MSDFVDISSAQGVPSPAALAAYRAAGHTRIVIKATEGSTYTWDGYAEAVRAAHAAGLDVWAYDFDRGLGDAGHFLAAAASASVMDLLTGIVLDFEATATAADGTAFMTAVEAARTGKQLVVYSGASFISTRGLPYRANWLWWQAAYTQIRPGPPAGWPEPSFWQFTDAARVAGFPSPVDCSHDLTPAPAPAPSPSPQPAPVQEDDMACLIARASNDTHVYLVTPSAGTKLYCPTQAVINDHVFLAGATTDKGGAPWQLDPAYMNSLHDLTPAGQTSAGAK